MTKKMTKLTKKQAEELNQLKIHGGLIVPFKNPDTKTYEALTRKGYAYQAEEYPGFGIKYKAF